jgi:pyruvate,water dikinase
MALGGSPFVLRLDEPAAVEAAVAGAKAANLAKAAAAGLPVLPGFAITTAAVERGIDDEAVRDAVASAWRATGGDDVDLVVRSSSTIEDAGTSSMAGRFTSILDVRGWPAFLDAVARVIASADRVRDDEGRAQPMAVLVQRQLDAAQGGVLFTVDPVTGAGHVTVDAVATRPDELVSGLVTAAHYVLSGRGRVLEHTGAKEPDLDHRTRRRLVRMARRAESSFGGPQDIEWAVDREGALWLLQARPVTAVGATGRGGRLLGPGPVAETFPDPLRRLEVDLLLEPLRAGISRALEVTGAASRREIARSPVVTTVGGWAAVDLELLGVQRRASRLWRRLRPSSQIRRLAAAWRVGRIRVALPSLADAVVRAVDDDLAAVGRLAERSDAELVELAERARRELVTVHTYEVLTGMLLDAPPGATPTGVVALAALERGRAAGASDDEIVATAPVVLALTAPRIAAPDERRLPPISVAAATPQVAGATENAADGGHDDLGTLSPRDALRLRARWIDELLVRVALTLGARLRAAGRIERPELVADLSWDELVAVLRGSDPPGDLAARAAVTAGAPLPSAFRVDERGNVVVRSPHRVAGRDAGGGIPAGGGRGDGVVVHRPPEGAGADVVLVTRHLEPQLVTALPHLRGLVSETGSPLSHLAILAREMHVPTVVGVDDALARFPPGTRVTVDGDTGALEVLTGAPQAEEAGDR